MEGAKYSGKDDAAHDAKVASEMAATVERISTNIWEIIARRSGQESQVIPQVFDAAADYLIEHGWRSGSDGRVMDRVKAEGLTPCLCISEALDWVLGGEYATRFKRGQPYRWELTRTLGIQEFMNNWWLFAANDRQTPEDGPFWAVGLLRTTAQRVRRQMLERADQPKAVATRAEVKERVTEPAFDESA